MTRPDTAVLATVRPPQPSTRFERILGEISDPLYVLQMPVFTALILATQRFAPGLIDHPARLARLGGAQTLIPFRAPHDLRCCRFRGHRR